MRSPRGDEHKRACGRQHGFQPGTWYTCCRAAGLQSRWAAARIGSSGGPAVGRRWAVPPGWRAGHAISRLKPPVIGHWLLHACEELGRRRLVASPPRAPRERAAGASTHSPSAHAPIRAHGRLGKGPRSAGWLDAMWPEAGGGAQARVGACASSPKSLCLLHISYRIILSIARLWLRRRRGCVAGQADGQKLAWPGLPAPVRALRKPAAAQIPPLAKNRSLAP